jgi:hypothetical protein
MTTGHLSQANEHSVQLSAKNPPDRATLDSTFLRILALFRKRDQNLGCYESAK